MLIYVCTHVQIYIYIYKNTTLKNVQVVHRKTKNKKIKRDQK